MSQKAVNEELSKEIREYDSSRDVTVAVGAAIAVLAGATAVAAGVASYAVGQLENYRKDVSSIWMACIPFMFPVVTGVAATYRRQMSSVGTHVCLLLATLLAGGVGYGLSIQNVFINRANCMPTSEVSCQRESLVYMYVGAGGAAAALTVLSLAVSAFSCSMALTRREVRRLAKERSGDVSHTPDRKPLLLSPTGCQ
ncbi:uncharacterized protein LOC131927892 [Physella acuta]|uniref:uncharacterized protein LOC131927892 n=1 Tax=Physella acuta TaxID=109671 RepID=UPI0027DB234F|nr:uncharacterized protein LOC131927892 [Physella acuta]